ncbi:MAG: SGNH hydrolase domain-containing protein [bacterium]
MLFYKKKQPLIIAALVLFTLLLLFIHSPTTIANEKQDLSVIADPQKSGEYVRKRFNALQGKAFDSSDQRKKLLLIGDSHAQDVLNMLAENNKTTGYQIRTRKIPTQCQIYLGDEQARYIPPKDKPLCANADNLQRAKKQLAQADVVILASNWKLWAVKHLTDTLNNLALKPTQQLIIIGRKNFGKINIRRYMRLSEEKRIALRNDVDNVQLAINQQMKQRLKGKQWVDIHALICGNHQSKTCPIFTPTGELMSFDGGHLTKAGASYIGQQLLTRIDL